MPQMFPMPFLLLTASVSILFLTSMMCIFWQHQSAPETPLDYKFESSNMFPQTW